MVSGLSGDRRANIVIFWSRLVLTEGAKIEWRSKPSFISTFTMHLSKDFVGNVCLQSLLGLVLNDVLSRWYFLFANWEKGQVREFGLRRRVFD